MRQHRGIRLGREWSGRMCGVGREWERRRRGAIVERERKEHAEVGHRVSLVTIHSMRSALLNTVPI